MRDKPYPPVSIRHRFGAESSMKTMFPQFLRVRFKSGIIRACYLLVKNNVDKLGHLEGTKVLFCDLQHTTLAADRDAKHTICLSCIDQAEDWKKFFVRYHETQLSQLIKDTDYKEEEIQRLLGNINILRPQALGAVGGATVGRPIEILLYNERIGILLHHLYMYNKQFEMDLSQESFFFHLM